MPVILITGASSGIGAALARHYAAPGTHLVLNARGIDRLNTVAAACRDLGATVATRSLDVRDRQTVGEWLRETHAATPLDLVIVNAGINGGHPGGDIETEAMAFETVDVNLNGALNVAPTLRDPDAGARERPDRPDLFSRGLRALARRTGL